MSIPSASYSITMRVALTSASDIPTIATAVSEAGGLVTALDVVEPIDGRMVIDVTCNATDEQHAELIGTSVEVGEGRARPRDKRPDVPHAPRWHDRDGAEGPA